jgi:hypothetical protein
MFKQTRGSTTRPNRSHLLSLILLTSLFQISNIAFPQSPNNHSYLELTESWKYRWGESPLNAVSLLGETKNRLPISHMIPLETEYQNRKLFFRMYPEDASIMGIEGILCGSQHELTRKIVKENIHLIILGCLFLATGLVSILIFLKRRQEKIHLVFGLFSLCIGIMAIYEARELRQLFFGRSSLADSIFIIIPFFMPGWLCMYFEYLFGSGYKSIIRRLWQIHLIYEVNKGSEFIISLPLQQ